MTAARIVGLPEAFRTVPISDTVAEVFKLGGW